MKRIVKNIPRTAVYDYTDVFGYKVYHTRNRVYEVKPTQIVSYTHEDWEYE